MRERVARYGRCLHPFMGTKSSPGLQQGLLLRGRLQRSPRFTQLRPHEKPENHPWGSAYSRERGTKLPWVLPLAPAAAPWDGSEEEAAWGMSYPQPLVWQQQGALRWPDLGCPCWQVGDRAQRGGSRAPLPIPMLGLRWLWPGKVLVPRVAH